MDDEILNANKKTITLFFCDVYGTIDGGFTDEDIIRFANLLDQVRRYDNSDYVVFKMLSSELPKIVDSYEKEISKHFNKNILVLPKFIELEKIREEKVAYAIQYVDELKKFYIINSVFYADDIKLLHEILNELLIEIDHIILNSIIPGNGENNLNFINGELEKAFTKRKTKKR